MAADDLVAKLTAAATGAVLLPGSAVAPENAKSLVENALDSEDIGPLVRPYPHSILLIRHGKSRVRLVAAVTMDFMTKASGANMCLTVCRSGLSLQQVRGARQTGLELTSSRGMADQQAR